MKKFVMGIDHGNGYVKAVSDAAKIMRPSEYALPGDVRQEIVAGSGVKALSTYKLGRYGDAQVVWGDDIHKVANSLATLATVERYKQQEYRYLSDAILASLLPNDLVEGIADVLVVTGCPSGEHGTAMEEALVDVYKGGHFITIDGAISRMVNVSNVVVVPQPLGSVLAMYLDKDGYVADESYESGYIGVIDVGSGTTDIDGINELAREPRDTDTFDIGISQAYQAIAARINKEDKTGMVKATELRVKRQLANGNLETYEVNKNHIIDISKIVDEEFRTLAGSIRSAINSRWKDRAKFDKILLTGGGAAIKPIANEFKKWHKDIVVMKNAQEANATGFYRYGKFLARAEE